MVPAIFSNPTSDNLVQNKKNTEIWQSQRWINRQRKFLELARLGVFERASSILDFLPVKNEEVIFMDFGGGSGWLYHKLITSHINLKVYRNIEYIDLHDSCSHEGNDYEYFPLSTGLSNFSNDQGLIVFYLNSVAQYLESDLALIDLVSAVAPKFVAIEDVTLSRGEEFFALQTYYETQIPYRFISLRNLILEMNKIGYVLDQNIPYARNAAKGYRYGFAENVTSYRIGRTVSLLFVKNK